MTYHHHTTQVVFICFVAITGLLWITDFPAPVSSSSRHALNDYTTYFLPPYIAVYDHYLHIYRKKAMIGFSH